MSRIDNIVYQFGNLNKKELKEVAARLLDMLQDSEGIRDDSERLDTCRKCGSEHILKYGKDKNGKQRYKCKSCGATFTATSFSVISKTRFSMETWERYIELLLIKAPLTYCAYECKMSVRTAFIWRHKILNALQKDQETRTLSGVVETDETYVSISYKGNHKNSKRFTMPREPLKRGSDNREQIGSRACVMYALERNGQTYGEVLGKGQPTIAMLTHAFGERILPDSLILSDKAVGIKNYFKSWDSVELVQLMAHVNTPGKNPKRTPPEIKGTYHIQNMNNLHTRFKRFLRPYNGVATKYLNNYVNLFVWIENHKNIKGLNMEAKTCDYVLRQGAYIKAEDIFSRPAVPYIPYSA